MDLVLLLVLTLASFRVTRLVTRDTITEPLRSRIPDNDSGLGYLIRCDWCAGIWVSGVIVLGTNLMHDFALPVLVWAAVAGGLGLLASWEG
jgi:hypothetical protein